MRRAVSFSIWLTPHSAATTLAACQNKRHFGDEFEERRAEERLTKVEAKLNELFKQQKELSEEVNEIDHKQESVAFWDRQRPKDTAETLEKFVISFVVIFGLIYSTLLDAYYGALRDIERAKGPKPPMVIDTTSGKSTVVGSGKEV